jgi:pimeloyl-ACP methyl ester carboxylesterase
MSDLPVPTWREAGEGKRAVVLLHGIGGGGAARWGPTLRALEGYRALAWEMPGYGASAPLPELTFPALAAALGRMLDQAGIEQADLVGHSIGGMIAQEFVATWPERVRSLVLYASPPAFGSRDPAFKERFLAARLGPLDAGLGMRAVAEGLVGSLMGGNPDPQALPAAIAAMSAIPEASYRAVLECLTTFDRRADLGSIACPTLILAGEEDRTAPFQGLLAMAEAIPGAEAVLVARAGHLAHLEQPNGFNPVLRRFLEAVPTGKE